MASHDFPAGTFLQTLTEEDRDGLLAIGRPVRWVRGERLVRTGEPATSAIVLRSGVIKVHKSGPDGAEVVLGLSGPGDLLGETSAVGGALRSADVTALGPIHAVMIDVPSLRRFLAERPEVMLALLDLALGRLHAADARRIEYATAESLPRVTSRLVELAERFGHVTEAGTVDVSLPINQEELASWSASSRESTARALRTLRDLELIETRRLRLVVRDLERLRAHAARL